MRALMMTTTIMALTCGLAEAREVNTFNGYIYKNETVNARDAVFVSIDRNHDGAINFKEFQRAAMLENEYEIFNMNDTNNDNIISPEEYRNFSKDGPSRIHSDPVNLLDYDHNVQR